MMICSLVYFFFFSSRRRHTRSYGDWSSDVCSSDLYLAFISGLTKRQPIVVSSIFMLRENAASALPTTNGARDMLRSEERRVGKEGRAQWRTCAWKKRGRDCDHG